ncbi:MAG: hypothetical protein UY72_C0019G0002 [Candidatus Uhrbacteria bacterium GW2011_GWD2_52_7]|uniref:Uncharacterized protein n=1 Tax=Candidatus Uhrbacteria bacterium GW2011_GWD2_52_7 TaxID=1618989 RepID=A0A0G1XH17_9BACT|nr:MAG: hypothetical protein UY72_C0019G0002 [Candidatus Uhrbacteria bacterium GW2011_GWD2_52_7]
MLVGAFLQSLLAPRRVYTLALRLHHVVRFGDPRLVHGVPGVDRHRVLRDRVHHLHARATAPSARLARRAVGGHRVTRRKTSSAVLQGEVHERARFRGFGVRSAQRARARHHHARGCETFHASRSSPHLRCDSRD